MNRELNVSKKGKHHHPEPVSSAALEARVQRALSEGRTQQALELAKQLWKQEQTPAHQALLRQVYLARAQQLRLQGYARDAGTVLEAALHFDHQDPAWLEKLAEELAACGQVRQALTLADRLPPESPARGRLLTLAADAAVRAGAAGRNTLPESLQGPFDLILTAFRQLESGQDEQARQTLQGIGLQSPFLEWKLLLRGLSAYYQKEDARALENWQRLQPERLPARLAAPLRFLIDPAYRVAQSPAAQAALQKQADRLQNQGLVQPLRAVQAALANPEHLPQAFRLAENALPALRQQMPHLVPRLAACFYWNIVEYGGPDDLPRYRRLFGEPADDPGLHRLRALGCDQHHESTLAHQAWQDFEKAVAGNPTAWPGDQANRARALVWSHMGDNAAAIPNPEKLKQLPPFLRDHPSFPKPLKPSAETCYRRSLELAPDLLEAYEALFDCYRQDHRDDKAEEVARQALARFPQHLATLQALAELRMNHRDYADALNLFQQALKVNPLDRNLRSQVGTAHTFNARAFAEAGRFEEARAQYQAALAYDDRHQPSSVYCKWAACEFKAGDAARAEELLQQALAGAGNNYLAIAYSMLIEAIRLKLPRPLKTRFDKEFVAALAEPPTASGAVAIGDTAAVHQLAGVTYFGQKTHEKKVLAYLEKAKKTPFTEIELERICESLLALGATKQLRAYTAMGQRRFPNNPRFPFLEAESYISLGPDKSPPWKVNPLLEKASRLAGAMPPDDKQKEFLETIHHRQQLMGLFDPFSSMNLFGGMFGSPFGDGGDDEWLDEDEDDEEFEDEGMPFFPFGKPKNKKRGRRR